MRVVAFGDQTYDCSEAVSQLLRVRDDAIVVDFLERATAVVKAELTRLSSEQQEETPRFATLAELVPRYRAGTLNPAVSQALTCITQLGLFIRYGSTVHGSAEHS